MLDQLIELTNRENFWGYWHLKLEEAHFKNNTLHFTVATKKDDWPPANETLTRWRITCKNVVAENINTRLRVPYCCINLFEHHPLLWQYEPAILVTIKGKPPSLELLLGEAFLMHINCCGNWLDFNYHFGALYHQLPQKGQAQILLPQRFLEPYSQLFQKHQLDVRSAPGHEGTEGLKLLFIGNANISPDDYCFGQAYVIAADFSATIIDPA